MPEGADPAGSVGFLVVASVVTVVSLAAYAINLGRRLAASRERNTRLRSSTEEPPAGQ